MQLGETIATYDVALALRGESGKFEVTSPAGEIYNVTCKPNHSISNLEWSGNKTDAQPFLIRKVAEPVIEPAKAMPPASLEAAQTKSVRSPFLLENQGPHASPPSVGAIAQLPSDPQAHAESAEAGDLELFYAECDPKTEQPSAFVYLNDRRSEAAARPEKPLTAPCTSFNEFDAEVRKLHAQLDQIRSRARKHFYKAQAAAASA